MSFAANPYMPLRLRKNEERRLRAGHLWVYSNEVNTTVTPLNNFRPGQLVAIEAHNRSLMGTGYVNPHSLICARLISRDPEVSIDESLLLKRLEQALALRQRIYDRPFYRLVYGEADGLPGLVVDRYGDYCVGQITTAGMESLKTEIETVLARLIGPKGLLWRNDVTARALEGLDTYVEVAYGEIPETIVVEENGVHFKVSIRSGQKTGWFFDQRDNRTRLSRYVEGGRVLDVFSYLGAAGIRAATQGAREVLCVDAAARALEGVSANAERNGVVRQVNTLQGDAFDVLKDLHAARESFDMVILDPPAFIKRRKDYSQGIQAYRRLNQRAMGLLNKGGLLVSCSCSYHLSREDLVKVILQSARHLRRSLQVLEHGRQGPDHPVHPAIPETDYLKAIFCRVLPA